MAEFPEALAKETNLPSQGIRTLRAGKAHPYPPNFDVTRRFGIVVCREAIVVTRDRIAVRWDWIAIERD